MGREWGPKERRAHLSQVDDHGHTGVVASVEGLDRRVAVGVADRVGELVEDGHVDGEAEGVVVAVEEGLVAGLAVKSEGDAEGVRVGAPDHHPAQHRWHRSLSEGQRTIGSQLWAAGWC